MDFSDDEFKAIRNVVLAAQRYREHRTLDCEQALFEALDTLERVQDIHSVNRE